MQLHNKPSLGRFPAQSPQQCIRVFYSQKRSLGWQRTAARGPLAVQAALDSSGLSSNSSLLGPAPPSGLGTSSLGPRRSSDKPAVNIDDIPLESGVGVDYSTLRSFLKEGKWREAEDEQRAKLIEAAGPAARQRNWVYWSEVGDIPVADMKTMDALWAAASGGRFGYKVQRELWIQNRRQWQRFFKAIKWVQGENNVYLKWPTEFIYSADAPKGHLPLTNALRGTRLLEAILEHPAFVPASMGGQPSGANGGAPGWVSSSGATAKVRPGSVQASSFSSAPPAPPPLQSEPPTSLEQTKYDLIAALVLIAALAAGGLLALAVRM